MTEMMKRSHALRDDTTTHYNCAQAVFIPFAEKKGISAAQATAITANFGSGMRAGLTCGAITGGLMALGLYGAGDAEASAEFMRRMKALHDGLPIAVTCSARRYTARRRKSHTATAWCTKPWKSSRKC